MIQKKISTQLPLGFQIPNEYSLEHFYPGQNVAVVEMIKKMAIGTGEFFLYLWGCEGAGKTHLLQAAIQTVNVQGLSAYYLSFKDRDKLNPSLLEGIDDLALVCLDDLHEVAKIASWEQVIFSLFNGLREKQNRLIVSANCPPNALPLQLADLKSRLGWGLTYRLQALSDLEKLKALQAQAAMRGLVLSQSVGLFLLKRAPRDLLQLFGLLERLDRASLAEQRALTIPFVKRVLGF